MFGQPAFAPTRGSDNEDREKDDVMDWEPSPAPTTRRPPGLEDRDYDSYLDSPSKHNWDSFAVQRQRMFPSQSDRDETGLESLIAGWGIGGAQPRSDVSLPSAPPQAHISMPYSTTAASTIVRLVSCLLAVARLTALVIVLVRHLPDDLVSMIDTITSSIEIAVILMTFMLPPRSPPPVRIGFLAMELIMRYIYLFGRQRKYGAFSETISNPWILGMTWGQWVMMNLTRAMV